MHFDRCMRTAPILVVLSLASRALAEPGDQQAAAYGLDPELIPVQCRSAVTGTRMGARISLASCIADLELEKLSLDASSASVAAVRTATSYSLLLLESVVAVGSPVERAEALSAEADLYTGMVSRMRRTAPNLMWHTTGKQLAQAQEEHRQLETAIAPWVRAAAAADDMVRKISRAHPEIARDLVAHHALKRAGTVARR